MKFLWDEFACDFSTLFIYPNVINSNFKYPITKFGMFLHLLIKICKLSKISFSLILNSVLDNNFCLRYFFNIASVRPQMMMLTFYSWSWNQLPNSILSFVSINRIILFNSKIIHFLILFAISFHCQWRKPARKIEEFFL